MSTTESPTKIPTADPTTRPTVSPSANPSISPSASPSNAPSVSPTASPTTTPSSSPSTYPSVTPSQTPSEAPSEKPSSYPSSFPSAFPSEVPSLHPSTFPSAAPSLSPTDVPSEVPSKFPSSSPSRSPEVHPTTSPTKSPEGSPTTPPTANPTQQPSKAPSVGPSQSPVLPCGTKARSVKIEATTGQNIHMFEVQVYASSENVALNKKATQSSTPHTDGGTPINSFDASRAVDGSRTTFSSTASEDIDAWWEVDLGADYDVDHVQILNRYCEDKSDPNFCLCHLSHANVKLLDAAGSTIASKELNNTCAFLNVGTSFVDDPSCPEIDVINTLSTGLDSDEGNGGSPAKAILGSFLGIAAFLGIALFLYKGRKKMQQQQRAERMWDDDNSNISPFVRRGRKHRSRGLHRKVAGQQVLDQLEDNSLLVNVKTTDSGGWNCTFDEDAIEFMNLRSPSGNSAGDVTSGFQQGMNLDEIEESLHSEKGEEEETDEALVKALKDALAVDVEPRSEEAAALIEKYSPGTLTQEEEEDPIQDVSKMPSLGHEIT